MVAVTEREGVVFTEITPGLMLGRAVAVLSQTEGRGEEMLSQQQAQISPMGEDRKALNEHIFRKADAPPAPLE